MTSLAKADDVGRRLWRRVAGVRATRSSGRLYVGCIVLEHVRKVGRG